MATKLPIRVKPNVFRNWIEDFSKLVSKKRYTKLKYELWRPLYLWSKFDDEWEEIEINYFEPDMLYIVPRHNNKLSPNGIEIMLGKDNSFGEYLLDAMNDLNKLCDIGASAKLAAEAISSSTAAISSLTDYYSTIQADLDYNRTVISSVTNSTPAWSVELNVDGLRITENGASKSLEEYVERQIEKYNNKSMENNKMMKFDFGPVDSSVHMSMYGMAIKNASGTYVAYDKNTGSVIDVDIVNFEGANKFMYKVPVALKSVCCGDVVLHARKPMFVQAAYADGRFKVLDIFDGEEKTIVPSRSPFGFDFMTKIVSFVDFGNATSSNPFGNMLPFLLMNDSNSKDNDMFLMMALAGGNTDFASNPMLMYFLMNKDGKSNDLLPFLLMGDVFKTPACTCACGQHASE